MTLIDLQFALGGVLIALEVFCYIFGLDSKKSIFDQLKQR